MANECSRRPTRKQRFQRWWRAFDARWACIDAQDIDLVNSNCTGRAESLRRAGVKGVGGYR